MISARIINSRWRNSSRLVYHLKPSVIEEKNVQLGCYALERSLDNSSSCMKFKYKDAKWGARQFTRHCVQAMVSFLKMGLAENLAAVNSTDATLLADEDKTARMIGRLSIHECVSVLSPSQLHLVNIDCYALILRSLYTYVGTVMFLHRKRPQLRVMLLDSRGLRRTKAVTLHELCNKRRSFPNNLRLQTDDITRLLLQTVRSGKLVVVFKAAIK